MKILICPAQRQFLFSHGSEFAYPHHFASALIKRDHTVKLVVGRQEVLAEGSVPTVATFGRAPDPGTGLTRAVVEAATFPWKYSRVARRLLAQEHFDILHHFLPFSHNTYNPLILGRSLELPSVLGPIQPPPARYAFEFAQWLGVSRSTGTAGIELGVRILSPLLQYLNRRTLGAVAALVASTSSTLDAYAELAPQARKFVIPIGVNAEHFRPLGAVEHDQFTFLFVGRLLPRKGIGTLIEAFRRVCMTNPDVRLLIAGHGPGMPRLKRAVDAWSLQTRVIFMGRVPQSTLPSMYAQADVVINPTVYEPFSTVNLEAMACGRMVITSDLPGMPELVPPSVGTLVPPGDPGTLAEAMQSVMCRTSVVQQKGAAARDHALRHYSWEAIVRRWENVYRLILV